MINESLRANDLRNLVKRVFEIDAYQSKIGDDKNVVVLSFTVESEDPAKDLEHFIEMGYDFVLDADVSPGETDDGVYKVFIELERNRHAPENILTILEGIERLTGIPDMRFRYFKNFKSHDANIKNLENEFEFKSDMYKFIQRVCNTFDFKFETYFKDYHGSKSFVIAFYNDLSYHPSFS